LPKKLVKVLELEAVDFAKFVVTAIHDRNRNVNIIKMLTV